MLLPLLLQRREQVRQRAPDVLNPHFFGKEPGLALPAKTSRPEGMPEAEPPLAPYQPPPVEDDDIIGGDNDVGMAPEIVVNLEEEVEDLNTDLLVMDRQSDSPHLPSPRVVAALDLYTLNNVPLVELPFDVLKVVLSTQPVTPPLIVGVAARHLCSRSRRRAAGIRFRFHQCRRHLRRHHRTPSIGIRWEGAFCVCARPQN